MERGGSHLFRILSCPALNTFKEELRGGAPPDALVGGVGEGCGVNCRLLVASNTIMPYLFLCVDAAFVEDNQGRQLPSFWKGAAQCGQVERHRWPLWQGIGELKMREGRRVPTRVSCALFSTTAQEGCHESSLFQAHLLERINIFAASSSIMVSIFSCVAGISKFYSKLTLSNAKQNLACYRSFASVDRKKRMRK